MDINCCYYFYIVRYVCTCELSCIHVLLSVGTRYATKREKSTRNYPIINESM